jgi:hypothetical protein
MIATSNISTLPDRHRVQQICKAASVLDAILSQEWEYRYFSYQSKWSENEEFCEMRNGQGDHMLILFREEGCVINGMAHEYYPKNKDKLTKGLPGVFHEFVFGEPVNSIGTTFCLWTTDDANWQTGAIEDLDDGSNEMLWIFDGNPQTYVDWAKVYYEEALLLNRETTTVVGNIYAGKQLTKDMVLTIVKDLNDWEQLKIDLQEINYPYQLT